MSQLTVHNLQAIPALAMLPVAQLAALAEVMVQHTFSVGQILFIEGEPVSGLWFVAAGRVKIIKHSLNGRVQGLCLMHRYKCFGACPLFQMEQNPATAQAVDEVTIYLLPAERLQALQQRSPKISLALTHIYSHYLAHLSQMSEVIGTWATADRINQCLLHHAVNTVPYPTLELTHEQIAILAGTVREVVTRHLNQLSAEGIVQHEVGRVILLQPNRLIPDCACVGVG